MNCEATLTSTCAEAPREVGGARHERLLSGDSDDDYDNYHPNDGDYEYQSSSQSSSQGSNDDDDESPESPPLPAPPVEAAAAAASPPRAVVTGESANGWAYDPPTAASSTRRLPELAE